MCLNLLRRQQFSARWLNCVQAHMCSLNSAISSCMLIILRPVSWITRWNVSTYFTILCLSMFLVPLSFYLLAINWTLFAVGLQANEAAYLVLTKVVILMKILVSFENVGVAIASMIFRKISAPLLQVVCVGGTLRPWKNLEWDNVGVVNMSLLFLRMVCDKSESGGCGIRYQRMRIWFILLC